MKRIIILMIVTLTSCAPSAENQSNKAAEQTSPFSSFKFEGEEVIVDHEGAEYKLLKLDTIAIQKLVALFKENFDINWQKRFSEDFVEYSNKLGIYPEENEQFTLMNKQGKQVELEILFTPEKRIQAKQFYENTYDKEVDIDKQLNRQALVEDLDQLEQLLLNKYSYYFLNSVDIKQEVQKIRASLPDQLSTYEFAILVNQLVNQFGDGHSRLRNIKFKEKGVLPFNTSLFDGQVVCLDGDQLLNKDFPYLHSINGLDVNTLLEASDKFLTPAASTQFQTRVRAERLNRIHLILQELGVEHEQLTIKLKNEQGATTTLTERVKKQKEFSATEKLALIEKIKNFNPYESKMMGEGIGYLRIESMESIKDSSNFLEALNTIKNAEKLIIDVRNNGGGTRDILLTLAPHFIDAQQGHIIGNVARLRTNTPERQQSLADRFIYQPDDTFFSEEDRSNINNFLASFEPSVRLSDSLYSPYYVLFIKGRKDAYFANTPTVVLLNEGCFSATDIFLSSFKEINNVALIGTKSGGGSGRSRRYKLKNSVIEIALSSMASFQPNGSLYDRVGVSPDITIENKTLSDFLRETDSQLDFAIDYLKKSD